MEESVFDPAGGFILPLSDYRYFSRGMGPYHKGDDIAAEAGTPVLAAAGGTVTNAQFHYSYGNVIVIDHGADRQGRHWYTLYAHLRDLLVEAGQTLSLIHISARTIPFIVLAPVSQCARPSQRGRKRHSIISYDYNVLLC